MATSSGETVVNAADSGRSLVGRIASIMDAFDQGQSVLTLVELSRIAGGFALASALYLERAAR